LKKDIGGTIKEIAKENLTEEYMMSYYATLG
jgi:hypothetical protein